MTRVIPEPLVLKVQRELLALRAQLALKVQLEPREQLALKAQLEPRVLPDHKVLRVPRDLAVPPCPT
ncbi:MAG TPA: hypothetical protein PLN94_07470 [Thiolinea sp.]|nr:hypothetical protein [Thiolinea sp.]